MEENGENRMEEWQRRLMLGMSWFPPDTEILGTETRSLSLASREALRMIGLPILDRSATPDRLEELDQLMVYAWLHSESIEVVSRSLWTDAWHSARGYQAESEEEIQVILSEWREIRERIISLVEATDIEIQPKPKTAKEKENNKIPSNVIGPTVFAHKVSVVMRETGMDRETVLWRLPVWEANQIYHAAMRWNGHWTVRVKERSPHDSFSDFEVKALDEEDSADE